MNMTFLKHTTASSPLLTLGIIVLFGWNGLGQSKDDIAPSRINPEKPLTQKVFIASQKSDFKNEVIEEIMINFKAVTFKVSDVSDLADVSIDDWDAIIILHSWEFLSPPRAVKRFIIKNRAKHDKLIVLTTSNGGVSKMDGVDAITGESIIIDSWEYANLIAQRLKTILSK